MSWWAAGGPLWLWSGTLSDIERSAAALRVQVSHDLQKLGDGRSVFGPLGVTKMPKKKKPTLESIGKEFKPIYEELAAMMDGLLNNTMTLEEARAVQKKADAKLKTMNADFKTVEADMKRKKK